jgi:hypothetical protein
MEHPFALQKSLEAARKLRNLLARPTLSSLYWRSPPSRVEERRSKNDSIIAEDNK